MRGRIRRFAIAAAVVFTAVAAAAGRTSPPDEGRNAADSLHRAQLEQELIMAEGTAVMYGELEAALLEMRQEGGER